MRFALLVVLLLALGCNEKAAPTTPFPRSSFDGLSEQSKEAVRTSQKIVLFPRIPKK